MTRVSCCLTHSVVPYSYPNCAIDYATPFAADTTTYLCPSDTIGPKRSKLQQWLTCTMSRSAYRPLADSRTSSPSSTFIATHARKHSYSSLSFSLPVFSRPTQPSHPSRVGAMRRWFRPSLGKKWRVLRSSGSASLNGSNHCWLTVKGDKLPCGGTHGLCLNVLLLPFLGHKNISSTMNFHVLHKFNTL